MGKSTEKKPRIEIKNEKKKILNDKTQEPNNINRISNE